MPDYYQNRREMKPLRTEQVTRTALEILTAEQAKVFLRGGRNDYDDAYIARAIKSVIGLLEMVAGYWVGLGTFKAYFDKNATDLNLEYWPITSITAVEYKDVETGQYVTLTENTDYTVYQGTRMTVKINRIPPTGITHINSRYWFDRRVAEYRVTYAGGNSSTSTVRPEIITALENELALYYMHRGGEDTGVTISGNVTVQTKNLLSTFRQ